ncbi:retrotransposon protein, putative, ty1-copia subclass [Tanacetum coccineum]
MEYKFQDQENSEDIFSFGSALEDFICVVFVPDRNILDKSRLWHSRLGYVNKKCIAQLQKDGWLESLDFKLDDVCESCLLGKITKSSFTGSCEKVDMDMFILLNISRIPLKYSKVSQLAPPRTPQLNRVAERRNRTLLDMVRSMMSRATLPMSLWGYALETTIHILNLVPTKKVSKTPFKTWKEKRHSLGHIKIWGCKVYVRREAQGKLEARFEKSLFISYPEELFGYLFYKPKDNVVFVAQRGVFLDREMISKEESGKVVTPVKPDDISLPIRRTSGRVSKPPQFYYGFHIEEDKSSDSTLSELDEPANYKEATASPEATKYKWIFKKKIEIDGKVHTYKARLVAKGYTQTHRIDYEETFSLMDVKTAFLNEKLTEDVFMAQLEGFENAKYPKRACKRQKAIYRLKQASRSWNLCFYEKVT